MCRMVIFSGYCVRCRMPYEVSELTQCVSCLEAKNNGAFGHCRRGVNYDQHDPGMECAPCSSALGMMDESDDLVAANNSVISSGGVSPGSSSSRTSTSSGGGGGGGLSYDTSKRRRVR
ncbi:unnamed protein product [Discula destructiva]